MKIENVAGHELPPGYWEAWDEYPDFEGLDSVEGIWDQLDQWRRFEPEFPRSKAKAHTRSRRKMMAEETEGITAFQQDILKAVHDDDRSYLAKLFKAMKLSNRPEPKMKAYRAAVDAFAQLFLFDDKRTTREEWPTKQMVRKRAEEILREAGYPPVSDRHWPRIFKQTGLSALPVGGYNRP
jgi:hypothetical protein